MEMATPGKKEIRDMGTSIIQEHPKGIRTRDLLDAITAKIPDATQTPEKLRNLIHSYIWDLDKSFPGKVSKPSRGLFVPATLNGTEAVTPVMAQAKCREQDFYDAFAEYLKNDLEEATDAVALGAAGGGKWGTPDVIGVYRLPRSAVISIQTEIIAAEIKTESGESIVAFGQAVAYRLFAAKSYIAMPNTISLEDKSRLESLCMLHGIGLAFFTNNPSNPDFKISVRAQRAIPDMFYANEFVERLRRRDTSLFNRLFG
jgi:hypothetical protein